MIVKQLSVFLENKTGRLNDVADILGKNGINMTAFSVADNSDFGILRVIVSDPEKALTVLKENKFAVSLTDVICLHTPNTPGSLSSILHILQRENVYIEYMYAFAEGEGANVIIRPDKMETGIE
ncbi:MAG TPA: amino acid-binding protein, partial [Paludibacteraceae bacterium]|nr:amino acid-binding protein [Paludibacteraceae bacterium]